MPQAMDLPGGRFWLGDTFDAMAQMPDASVDMILADLPYGTTACKWDSVLPFDQLWTAYDRIAKPNAAVVLTASQPFTSALVMSNVKAFKYCWVWEKKSVTGFANAKKQPLRHLEDVCVFYRNLPTYSPQGLVRAGIVRKNSATDGGASLKSEHVSNGKGSLRTPGLEREQEFTNYPRQLLEFSRDRDRDKIHPTQKPVALFEYLIRTYTNTGDLVLDNTAGSGTTAIAALNTKRKYWCVERDETYFAKAVTRIMEHAAK